MSSIKDSYIKEQEALVNNSTQDSDDNYNAYTHSIDQYTEHVVTPLDYARNVFEHPVSKVTHYLASLFPIARWFWFYNAQWLTYDVIAGITVGVVVVPQSMSYLQLAGLDAQYGLYSSFVGVFIYCFFATSKDVSIGPVAVMSMQVGKVVAKVQEEYPDASAALIGTFLSLTCGAIALGLGVLRLGFILEYIPIPLVFAFMTGSALNIVSGQVPLLMGYNSLVNTRQATYLTIIDTLKHLPDTKVDLAFGLVSLFVLYLWKYGCDFAMKRSPRWKRVFFYLQVLRHAVVIVLATLISWAIVHPWLKRHPGGKLFSIIGEVPSGLRDTGAMTLPPHDVITKIAGEIPVSVIILLLEHISISKSFGRLNDYKVVPDQELIAIGVTNLVGTFFNAYPATGSFSRSALKAKCGVRTPFAGIFTGAVVLLALYCLTKAFYYIPKLALSLIIIHCVSDLVASWRVTWKLYQTSFLDFVIFIVGVFIAVFASIEDAIYFSVCASVAVLLWRLSKPNGVFLGKVRVAEAVNIKVKTADESENSSTNGTQDDTKQVSSDAQPQYDLQFHTRWVPLPDRANFVHTSLINSAVDVLPAPPGVFVFRPSESFTYPNSSRQIDVILDEVKSKTRTHQSKIYKTIGDRPWNDTPELVFSELPVAKGFKRLFKGNFKRSQAAQVEEDVSGDSDNSVVTQEVDTRPFARIIHFDFSCVTAVDMTSVQALVDLRALVYRYSGVEVEYHFSGLLSPWIRKSLIAAGFGRPSSDAQYRDVEEEIEGVKNHVDVALDENNQLVAAIPTDTPFIHLDIPDYH